MKTIFKTFIAASAGLMLSFAAFANPFDDQTGWELEKEKKGFTAWTKQEEGKRVKTYRVQGTFKSNRDKIMATLTDPNGYHEWFSKSNASKEVKRMGEFEYIIWTDYDMPFIYTDRDMVLHGKGEQISESAMLILISSASDAYPEQEKYVRVKDTQQAILIEELPGGEYRVTQQVYLDPGEEIGAGLVNGRLGGEAINFMRDLAEALEQ